MTEQQQPAKKFGGRKPGARDRVTIIRDQIRDDIPGILQKQQELALQGDQTAAQILLKYWAAPPKQIDTYIERGGTELAGLAPDARLSRIADLVARGQMSLECGEALTRLAEAELNAQVLDKLRKLQKAIEEGADLESILRRLSNISVPGNTEAAFEGFLN